MTYKEKLFKGYWSHSLYRVMYSSGKIKSELNVVDMDELNFVAVLSL